MRTNLSISIAAAVLLTLGAMHAPAAAQELDARELAALIDQHVDRRLADAGLEASPPADDAEFARRLYLDLTGVIPPAVRVGRFLDSRDGDKRARLVDELLSSPAYARHMADIWDSLLFKRTADNKALPLAPLSAWLVDAFDHNRPWDQVVYSLLTASGPQRENGAVTIFMNESRQIGPHDATSILTRALLGVRLECAQCHDHPYADWTQTQYWGMAAFFNRLDFTKRFDDVDISVDIPSRQKHPGGRRYGIRETSKASPRHLPDRALNVEPMLLDGHKPLVAFVDSPVEDDEPPAYTGPLRPLLATWVIDAENPWFARSMVNRLWAQMFGRGLVDPVDDLRDDNPASHPELLEALTDQFVAHRFDVKYLLRAIADSRAYHRTSLPHALGGDEELYSHMPTKVMTPEQLFDSLAVVLGQKAVARKKTLAKARARFVAFLQTDEEPDPLVYRRGIPQALKLMNDRYYQKGVERRAEEIARSSRSTREAINQLYLLTLARRPTTAERRRMLTFADRYDEPARAYRGMLWALVNSSEFTLNH